MIDAPSRRDLALRVALAHAPRGTGFDRCIPTASTIVAALTAHGVAASVLRLSGYRGDPAPADARWRRLPAGGWIHYVAWLPDDGIAIDATARQFDRAAERVEIINAAAIASAWDRMTDAD